MDGEDEEYYLSSESEEEDDVGHPLETKDEVFENLKQGFLYHKNGPAQQYDWTKDDIAKMSRIIQDSVATVKKGRRNVRAMNFKGEPFPGGLLGWVNSVRTGRYFPDNTKIERGKALVSGEKSNFWLWNYVSETLIHEFDYWTEWQKVNKTLKPEETKYPDISKMIFRHSDDFVGGLWSDFSKHWQRFVDEMG